MQNKNIKGCQYQQGTLAGYQIKQYLLEKFNYQCAYCDKKNTILEIEHVVPRSRGGSNRVSNLVIACVDCNRKKDRLSIDVFLANKPAKLAEIKKQLKTSLRDAALINSTVKTLAEVICGLGFDLETSVGARTKFNRKRFNIEKDHALDAACVGIFGGITNLPNNTLVIKSTGRGKHARTLPDKHGFPRLYLSRSKRSHIIQTGDWVKSKTLKGKYKGVIRIGRAVVRADGRVDVGSKGTVKSVDCVILQRDAGYDFKLRRN
jgi:hypothetical protein